MSTKAVRAARSKQDKIAIAAVEKLVAELVELRSKPTDEEIARKEERLKEIRAVCAKVESFLTATIDKLHDLQDEIGLAVDKILLASGHETFKGH